MRCTATADDSKEEFLMNQKRETTKKLVLGAILTALVVILQLLGSFIRFGPFSISLVLIPIVLGAATCGKSVSTWLGFVFGVVVLITDSAAFMAISVPGTIITVLLKGMACGFASGLVYELIAKKNRYLAIAVAAVVCPVVNTGVFVLGCIAFFLETISQWGAGEGYNNAFSYLFLGMIGLNFIAELVSNIVLSPVIVRLLNISKKEI